MKILSAAEMREVDRLTTEKFGIPSLLLMEAAAERTVEAVERRSGSLSSKRVLVVCGRGNNGGDGAAIARQLHSRGAQVNLLMIGRISDTRGDALGNLQVAAALASIPKSTLRLVEVETGERFRLEARSQVYDVVIDAIFGTGLARPASGIFEEAIECVNELRLKTLVVAVDMPSGAASDSADLIGPTVRAHLTVTFTAPKIANVLPPAADFAGELIVAPIGSPNELLATSGSQLTLVDRTIVSSWLAESRRSPHANKGDVGKVLVIAGSRGKTGAACLVGEAALRAGCGLVTVATPRSCQPVLASHLISECMTEALVETPSGSVAVEAVDLALAAAAERDVVAVGPGLGAVEKSTRAFVRSVVVLRQRPMVLDADALNSLAPWAPDLRGSEELPLILTPHPIEMVRLVGKQIAKVVRNRIDIAREFATEHHVILVLKGSKTVVAAPDGEVYVNPTGNAGMATGGSGDVLTGIIAGLLAQKPDDAIGATIAAVYLHGLAGDIAASRRGTRSMIASDISAHLGDAFIDVGGESERAAE
jgi:ADP-dependent NAD(P)H-hydrate dehydratase / NAD(P)H-hydrate epimerase